MELTIIEYDMVQTYPSEIAASALCLANRLLDGSKWVRFNSIGSTLCLLSDKDSFKEVLQVELQRSHVRGKTFLAGRICPGDRRILILFLKFDVLLLEKTFPFHSDVN